MTRNDLMKFKFDKDRDCIGFSVEVAGQDFVYTRNKELEIKTNSQGQIWRVQCISMPYVFPIVEFETKRKDMMIVKTAEMGLLHIQSQLRVVQGQMEDVCMEINKIVLGNGGGLDYGA